MLPLKDTFGRLHDNLRVSVRAPLTLRSVPGILIPVVNVLALAIIGSYGLWRAWGAGSL